MEKTITITLELGKAHAITLAAIIAGGLEAGAEKCLPPNAEGTDVELFNLIAPDILDIGKGIIDKANAL